VLDFLFGEGQYGLRFLFAIIVVLESARLKPPSA
jgi:hypothetical protein